jgi:hypothetical protein
MSKVCSGTGQSAFSTTDALAMLFVVDEAAFAANSAVPMPVATRVAVSRLLQAYLDGHHVVVMHPRACRAIEESHDFSADERAAAAKIRARFAEHGRLQNEVAVYAEVVDAAIAAPQRVGQVWRVSMHWIAAQPLQPTHLVAEDLNDISVLEGAAIDYRNVRRLFGLCARTTPMPGGGGNTGRVLKRVAVDDQRMAVCVVDSDRDCAVASAGHSASACLAIHGPGLYEVRLTDGRTLENSLPWRLLDLIRPHAPLAPSQLLSALEAVQLGAAKWANLKRGKRGYDLVRSSCAGCQQHHEAVAAGMGVPDDCCPGGCTAANFGMCTKEIYAGYGAPTLADIGRHLDQSADNTYRHLDYIPSRGEDEWMNLGRTVFEYGLGTMARRV